MRFTQKTPCKNCPYRKDAPLAHWDKGHFKDLLENSEDSIGKTYLCHKENDNPCIGWLIDQKKNRYPSIQLCLSLIKHDVKADYLKSLKSNTPMYASVKEMIAANFPELLTDKHKNQTP